MICGFVTPTVHTFNYKLYYCKTRTIQILNVKLWRALEICVKGHSRSLKMTPINRRYDFLLVCHCNCSYVVYHFRVIWRLKYHDLEIYVRGHWRSLEMAPFDRLHMSSYSSSIVTMAVSCTVFEIKQNIDGKRQFFHTSVVFNLHCSLEPFEFLPKISIQTVRIPKLDGAKYCRKVHISAWSATTSQTTDGYKPNVT